MFSLKKSLFSLAICSIACLWLANEALAIPAWARKYKTSCATCHYAYPKLNGFGKAFKNNGFRYPAGQDPEMTKEEPVSLGSEGYKRAFPDAIWPADIPGTAPVSLHTVGRFNYVPDTEEAKTNFEFPHEVEILYGGTIGENVSFFGEVEIENEDGETEIGFPFIAQWDFNPKWHIRFGAVSPDPTPDHMRLTRSHYNVASFRSRNRWRLRDGQAGIELWGAGNGAGGKGGYTFQLGLVNGQGSNDPNSSKDFYGRFTYKIGGLGTIGGTEGQGGEQSAHYLDNNLRLGGFFYTGTVAGANGDEDLSVFGGDVDFWIQRFILNGTLLYMNSKIDNTPDRKSLAWYAQGNAVLYPWLIGLVRYEYTDSDTDDDSTDAQTTFVPGITAVLRANVRITAEYFLPLDDARKNADAFTLQVQLGF